MSNKGFRRIDNDTFNSLMAAPLTGSEYKVILAIVNQTWGFGKKSEAIKLDKFKKLTGLTQQGLVKAIRKLKSKEIITTEAPITKRGPKSTVTYAITDPNTWRVSEPQLPNSTTKVSKPQLQSYATTVDRVSKLPTREGETVKKLIKDTIKEKGTTLKEDDTLNHDDNIGSSFEGKVSSALSDGRRGTALKGDDYRRSTETENKPIPQSPLPFGDAIEAFIRSHSPADFYQIVRSTGITGTQVETTLHNDTRFHQDSRSRKWMLDGNTPITSEGSFPAPKSHENKPESHPSASVAVPTKVKPVNVSDLNRKLKPSEWPGDFRKMSGYEFGNAIREILYVLDYGRAPGRPPEFVGNLEEMLQYEDRPVSDVQYNLLKQWFEFVCNDAKVSFRKTV